MTEPIRGAHHLRGPLAWVSHYRLTYAYCVSILFLTTLVQAGLIR